MATDTHETYDVAGGLVQQETWSNGTQQGDPPAGYVRADGDGTILEQRALTADESAQLADEDVGDRLGGNRKTLNAKAAAALTANATYLAVTTPTAAQNTAQIKALTRQTNVLIRLLLDQLDTTIGT